LISSKLAEIPIQEGAEPSRPANNEQQDYYLQLHMCLHCTYLLTAL